MEPKKSGLGVVVAVMAWWEAGVAAACELSECDFAAMRPSAKTITARAGNVFMINVRFAGIACSLQCI